MTRPELTPAEFNVMKSHPEKGLRLIENYRWATPDIKGIVTDTLGAQRHYVINVPVGTPELDALASHVTASSIRLARYLSGPQAHLKYGMNHSEGAIELYTSCGKA